MLASTPPPPPPSSSPPSPPAPSSSPLPPPPSSSSPPAIAYLDQDPRFHLANRIYLFVVCIVNIACLITVQCVDIMKVNNNFTGASATFSVWSTAMNQMSPSRQAKAIQGLTVAALALALLEPVVWYCFLWKLYRKRSEPGYVDLAYFMRFFMIASILAVLIMTATFPSIELNGGQIIFAITFTPFIGAFIIAGLIGLTLTQILFNICAMCSNLTEGPLTDNLHRNKVPQAKPLNEKTPILVESYQSIP